MAVKLLRVPEVAEMTGISENTLRHWRHQGTGPRSARLGRRIVYRESDVEGWIEAQFADAVGGTSADLDG
ncbi:MAG: helix-turn-helix domain-containing protein [Nocardioides sp.]|uniref:helix-turn-helix transcriptional regulator n=1 Tax=Nocardioides sp. TaxID=35761 RepID=UPI002396883C|nr:helix-turn-helix domain-containing protein [Nocardioides sp.]MDE0778926.1 helix-turn-helix domain-containing protein [Nocardioides sp.]